MEDGRLFLLGGAITRSIRNLTFLAAAMGLALLWAGCRPGNDPDAVANAAMAARRTGSYKASYQVVTWLEGAARPIAGAGVLEFQFPDQSRRIAGDLEVITVGSEVWSRVGSRWRQEKLASPPLDPHLYLAAAKEVRKVGEQRYTFRLDPMAYRREMERLLGELSPTLAQHLDSLAAEGEAALGKDGLPQSVTIRTRSLAPGRRVQMTEAKFVFLEFGADYDIRPPGQEG